MLKIFILSIFLFGESEPLIKFHKNSATVWHPQQNITGEISGFTAKELMVYHNKDSFLIKVNDNQFEFEVIHRNQENKMWIVVPDGDLGHVSDTLVHILGYTPKPIVKPIATVLENNVISLEAVTIENPYNSEFTYHWQEDERNPAASQIDNSNDPTAKVKLPSDKGTYYYNLLIVADQDSVWYQTLVQRNEAQIDPYNIDSEDTPWMSDAVLYQLIPNSFVEEGQYNDIKAKLPEIKELGINTVWLQPVFKSHRKGSQGYDVVDYLALNPDLGTEAELKELIKTAKDLEIRILFDVVLNHTSIHHPYAKDRVENKTASHYYDYYQYTDDGTPYSSFYDQDEHGFINYFWPHLVNLNYENEEVQRWMLEVCKYWIREYDIDGYRFDAIWGVNARRPDFASRLRTELKIIKPEVLLLAEDKGSVPEVFELGFEAAYDWAADTNWVSKWNWEYQYSEEESFTVFNHPEYNQRVELLRQAIFQNEDNHHRQLRYLENNDIPRFIVHHGLERTKMAAALMFALPGIPMLYNGQETGKTGHPYRTKAIFHADSSIRSYDHHGLFDYYQKLISLRENSTALSAPHIKEIQVENSTPVFAFQRKDQNENYLILVNLSPDQVKAEIDLQKLNIEPSSNVEFSDILNEKDFKVKKRDKNFNVPMEGYTSRWIKIN